MVDPEEIVDDELKNVSDYATGLEAARHVLESNEKKKKRLILRLAALLEREATPKEMISAKLGDDLRAYVTDRYVRMVLDEAFKQKSKVREPKAITITTQGAQEMELEKPAEKFPQSRDESPPQKPLQKQIARKAVVTLNFGLVNGLIDKLDSLRREHRSKKCYVISQTAEFEEPKVDAVDKA